MQRKSFADMTCPIARSLEHVGEWWSMLILRDAFGGTTRFDDFQRSLGIAPNMLTRRLAALVDAGLLERRPYSERPPRDEYVLTERGRDFKPVLTPLVGAGSTSRRASFVDPPARAWRRAAGLRSPRVFTPAPARRGDAPAAGTSSRQGGTAVSTLAADLPIAGAAERAAATARPPPTR